METHRISPASAAKFRMIDIGEKRETQRRAVASGVFFAKAETISRIRDRSLPKGDVLTLAEVAGIQGAKQTSNLLPLCHPLSLTSVRVWMEAGSDQIRVFCEAKTVGKTGVEMEALCGVNAALLCIYDLTKGIDPVLRLGDVCLEVKEGGKSGQWLHPESPRALGLKTDISPHDFSTALSKLSAVVITLSDRCSRNESIDKSGPIASQWLKTHGAVVKSEILLPDEKSRLRAELLRLLEVDAPDLIITSGGTGLSKRDITPETILAVSQELGGREVPGIGEVLRRDGSKFTQLAWLSRSVAVVIRETLIVCLPGNPSAVVEGLDSVRSLIGHVLHVTVGGGHE